MRRKRIITVCVLTFLLAAAVGYRFLRHRSFPINSSETYGTRKEEPVVGLYDSKSLQLADSLNDSKHIFISWNSLSETEIQAKLTPLIASGQHLLITLETWPVFTDSSSKDNVLIQLADGVYDRKIKTLASLLSKYPQWIMLRFAPEMEVYINHYPWQMQSGNVFVKAFRHVSALMKRNAGNIKMVWAPAGYPGAEEYWPGAAWVDMVSISIKGNLQAVTNYYVEPSTLEEQIRRKLIRTRFFNKPVILLGSEAANAANFKSKDVENAIQAIAANQEILYMDSNMLDKEGTAGLVRNGDSLTIGVYDPQVKIVSNSSVSVEHLFANFGNLADGTFKKRFSDVIARNHGVIVTMEPWRDKDLEKDDQLIKHILAGQYDPQFNYLFSIINSTTKTVYLRWLHEMEIPITRYPWQSQDPVDYIKAFRYFVHKFQPRPANVHFVWGPAGDRGALEFWPGSDVVDYVSIAIYGLPDKNITDHTKQESFNVIFGRKYYRLKGTNKPMLVAEFGVKGPQDYKQNWLNEAAKAIRERPEIIGVSYFNFADSPKAWGNIDTPDWSISPAVFDNFVQQLHLIPKK